MCFPRRNITDERCLVHCRVPTAQSPTMADRRRALPRSVAVQPLSSTRIQPFQRCSSGSSAAASAPNCSVARAPRLLARPTAPRLAAAARLLLLLLVLALLLLAAAVEAVPVAGEQLYLVLVSVPVLDKVLPLKSLAEELLHRGYRIGFALPEVRSGLALYVNYQWWRADSGDRTAGTGSRTSTGSSSSR